MAEQIIFKQCSKCKGDPKPLSDFQRRKDSKDGHRNDCKICRYKYEIEYSQTEKGKAVRKKALLRYDKSDKGKATHKRYQQGEKFKVTQKRYLQTEKGKAKVERYQQSKKGKAAQRAGQKRFRVRHPNQPKALIAVRDAIKKGILPKPNSLQCHYGDHQAQEYHHHKGYAPEHWLDVIPVCKKCHTNIRKLAS